MTAPETMLALAARCEAASGADRKLDALICNATHAHPDGYEMRGPYSDGDIMFFAKDAAPNNKPVFWALSYTSSLDAAMSLVPEAMVTINLRCRDGVWGAGMFNEHSLGQVGKGSTKTLAILAAALRAIASVQS